METEGLIQRLQHDHRQQHEGQTVGSDRSLRRRPQRLIRQPQQQGADRILIQVPGEQNPERLEKLLGSTAKLEFRMLADSPSGDVDMLPSKDEKGAKVPVERRVMADGGELTDAQPAFDQQSHEPMVSFKFNLRGAQRFGQATAENVGRPTTKYYTNPLIHEVAP